jgi:hypothetical protein
MGITNYPDGISSFGVPALGGGGLLTTGKFFFVHSGTGSNGNAGKEPKRPLATIDYAIGLCTADKGDTIIVMPGHAETVSGAAGINCDVAGVKIIGLGQGASRPTITMSATGSTIAIGAASVWLENLLLITTAVVVKAIDVNEADCTLKDIEFRNSTTNTPAIGIDVNGGSANACDRTRILGLIYDTGTNTGASAAIELGEVANKVEIRGCVIFGDFSSAPIHNPTGKVLTNLLVADCELTNLSTGNHSVELVSACTGNLIRNQYHNDMTQATGVDPGSCFSFECYHDDVINTSAIVAPAVT